MAEIVGGGDPGGVLHPHGQGFRRSSTQAAAFRDKTGAGVDRGCGILYASTEAALRRASTAAGQTGGNGTATATNGNTINTSGRTSPGLPDRVSESRSRWPDHKPGPSRRRCRGLVRSGFTVDCDGMATASHRVIDHWAETL